MPAKTGKIGIVLSSVPAYSETFFQTKINGLIENGFEVILFAKGNRNERMKAKLAEPYPVLKLRPVMFVIIPLVLLQLIIRSPRNLFRYTQLLRTEGLDFIQVIERIYMDAHMLPYRLDWLHFGFITQVIGREGLAKAMGAKMAVSIRGFDISIFPLTNPGKIEKVWPYLDKLHTISDDLLVAAKELGLPDSVKTQKITPAIDVAKFEMREHKSFEKQDQVKLLTIARLHWKKGLEYALEACLLLKNQGFKINYTIVGEGQEREKLTFLTHQMGLNGEVNLIGKLDQEEIIHLLHESNIYLQPSIQEGFCNAVLEAQAAGLLCVVSDAEGLTENILHERTGWIIPKRSTVHLADKIKEVILLDTEKKEDIRKAAVVRVTSLFNIDHHTESWSKFYS